MERTQLEVIVFNCDYDNLGQVWVDNDDKVGMVMCIGEPYVFVGKVIVEIINDDVELTPLPNYEELPPIGSVGILAPGKPTVRIIKHLLDEKPF